MIWTRREFVKVSALGLAGGVLAGQPLGAWTRGRRAGCADAPGVLELAPKDTITSGGIIWTGYVGTVHAR